MQLQLGARAYLHHYERYGVGADYVRERLELVQAVVDEYAALAARGAGGARRASLGGSPSCVASPAGPRELPPSERSPPVSA